MNDWQPIESALKTKPCPNCGGQGATDVAVADGAMQHTGAEQTCGACNGTGRVANRKPIWAYVPEGYQTSLVYSEGRWRRKHGDTAWLRPTHYKPIPEPPEAP